MWLPSLFVVWLWRFSLCLCALHFLQHFCPTGWCRFFGGCFATPLVTSPANALPLVFISSSADTWPPWSLLPRIFCRCGHAGFCGGYFAVEDALALSLADTLPKLVWSSLGACFATASSSTCRLLLCCFLIIGSVCVGVVAGVVFPPPFFLAVLCVFRTVVIPRLIASLLYLFRCYSLLIKKTCLRYDPEKKKTRWCW